MDCMLIVAPFVHQSFLFANCKPYPNLSAIGLGLGRGRWGDAVSSRLILYAFSRTRVHSSNTILRKGGLSQRKRDIPSYRRLYLSPPGATTLPPILNRFEPQIMLPTNLDILTENYESSAINSEQFWRSAVSHEARLIFNKDTHMVVPNRVLVRSLYAAAACMCWTDPYKKRLVNETNQQLIR